jgi:hypothetical protein
MASTTLVMASIAELLGVAARSLKAACAGAGDTLGAVSSGGGGLARASASFLLANSA